MHILVRVYLCVYAHIKPLEGSTLGSQMHIARLYMCVYVLIHIYANQACAIVFILRHALSCEVSRVLLPLAALRTRCILSRVHVLTARAVLSVVAAGMMYCLCLYVCPVVSCT